MTKDEFYAWSDRLDVLAAQIKRLGGRYRAPSELVATLDKETEAWTDFLVEMYMRVQEGKAGELEQFRWSRRSY